MLLPLGSLLLGCGEEFSSRAGAGGGAGATTSTSTSAGASGGGGAGAMGGTGGFGGGGASNGGGGSGIVDPCTVPGKIRSVRDDFGDGDLAPWVPSDLATAQQVDGELVFEFTGGAQWVNVHRPEWLDLTGCSLSVQLADVPAPLENLQMELTFGPDDANRVVFGARAGGLYHRVLTNGALNSEWDENVSAFGIRIREAGGQIHFEARANADIWIEPGAPIPAPDFVNHGRIELRAGPTQDQPATGTVAFDNVNLGW